jgi:microsomal dipeptidase-like Zn-dependent dipeptidase
MAHLGFGGSIVWGYAGEPGGNLGPIPASMRRGHDAVEGATHGHIVPIFIRTLTNAFLGDWFKHGEEGAPEFTSWPSINTWTHQQVYKDWLFRAYQGGLRLMVMLAVNSEDEFGRGEDELPVLRHHVAQPVKADGRTSNDMEALDWQIRAAYLLQAEIDRECGGLGKGWYRIVRDPEEARDAISNGNLAVILGTELQHLFNCDMDRPACTRETVIEGLNRLEAMGVNYVFPVHHKINQFAGPAKFSFANNGPSEKCPDHQPPYEHVCSAVGLTELGRFLVEELSARGMLMDTEHMGRKTFDDAMSIAERRRYPVLAGHVVPFDLVTDKNKSQRTERAKIQAQIERIFRVGGIVAPMLGTSAGVYNRPGSRPIAIPCTTTDGGGADQWANAYLFIKDLAGSRGLGHVSLGSDWNGFAGWPGPPCRGEPQVQYPYPLPPALLTARIGPVSEMSLFVWPSSRTWDFNRVGAAHIGMTPDLLQEVHLLGVSSTDLEPLYRSARAVVDLWIDVRNRTDPWSRHHLRWAPQRPFDTLNFDGADDPTRIVEAAPGFAICRSRTGHRLGFLDRGRCELVEPSPEFDVNPVEISAYHDGRCLTGASSWKPAAIVQRVCGSGANQRWLVREMASRRVRIENSLTGQCLSSSGAQGRVVEVGCDPADHNQEWEPCRSGNTFELIGSAETCVAVKDQSRADGAEIVEDPCTGAANQLWSIEALRSRDYESLFQADRGRYAWLTSKTTDYPHAVFVDSERQICKGDTGWLGTIHGHECVGKTYDGRWTSTTMYLGLYQTP